MSSVESRSIVEARLIETTAITSALGFPRMGHTRELKKALESYWTGTSSAGDLEMTAARLRKRHWELMRSAGIDHIPSNDFSLYDHVLDMACTVGAVPARYAGLTHPLKRYFAMARGHQETGIDVPALEMTKWFDTNYHYIVPELAERQTFALNADKIMHEISEARLLGIETRPVILGPVSFLLLSKMASGHASAATTLELLDDLLPVYRELLDVLAAERVAWVQLDEPCLVLDSDERRRAVYAKAFAALRGQPVKVLLTTYFGSVAHHMDLIADSGFEALHIDLVRAPEALPETLRRLPKSMALSLGVVDGRNIWRTNLDAAHALLHTAVATLGESRVMVGPSCSLLHTPVDLEMETGLDAELRSWMAFARQKLVEIRALANNLTTSQPSGAAFIASRESQTSRRASPRTRNATVRDRLSAVSASMLRRSSSYAVRAEKQAQRFALPAFPTTTIGSFPQTGDVRGARAAMRKGELTAKEYTEFIEDETKRCLRRQEALGLDVLVHGEFERTDMVEYFGEQLEGFTFTQNGWVQSYGSRCVKPPVLFGDVMRPSAMTVRWSQFAQAQTKRPVKGMLTGPVTILQWSFVRDDQPRSETCRQVGLALRDEVCDLEAAGIAMIQVDEPAIREGLPLRRGDWKAYLAWAVDAFLLATSGVRDETQIHTHMCYSDFGDILDAIAVMDADVLSIETSRSKMELLEDFARFSYPNGIGPGVYDIHSPRVPSTGEMIELLARAAQVLWPKQLWVNPDCGLKTRGWPEVEAALANMVQAAREMRTRV